MYLLRKTVPVALLLVAGLASAAPSTPLRAGVGQETMEEKRDRKLKLPFLKKAAWLTDYDEALAEGKKSGKLLFAYFTRSYSP